MVLNQHTGSTLTFSLNALCMEDKSNCFRKEGIMLMCATLLSRGKQLMYPYC